MLLLTFDLSHLQKQHPPCRLNVDATQAYFLNPSDQASSVFMQQTRLLITPLSMTKRARNELHHRLLKIGFILAGIAAFGALLTMIVIAIKKVQSGHGMDTYYSVWMVKDNWIGFIVFIGVTVISLSVGAIITFVMKRRENRRIEKEFSRENHG
jgi:uncharacterized membrane protein